MCALESAFDVSYAVSQEPTRTIFWLVDAVLPVVSHHHCRGHPHRPQLLQHQEGVSGGRYSQEGMGACWV